MLLPFVRAAINGPTPLHLIHAPVEGTGKTLLANVITLVATGRSVEAIAEARDDDEWRKRLTAALAEAPTFLVFDNLNRTLDSGALASALTAPTIKDRLLGVSKTVVLPVRCVWLATGNNVKLSRDMVRRTVSIRLDANTATPGDRADFRHPDLMAWAKEHRDRLIWAALVLVQAYFVAGRPLGKETLGGYEGWTQVIGGILNVAGIAGLLENAGDFQETATDDSDEWRPFLFAWWQRYAEQPVGVAQLYELAKGQELLDAVLGDHGERSQRIRLGKELGRLTDRVFGQYRLERAGEDHSKRQLYRLRKVTTARAAAEPMPPVPTANSPGALEKKIHVHLADPGRQGKKRRPRGG
jgi:hypothetical protein